MAESVESRREINPVAKQDRPKQASRSQRRVADLDATQLERKRAIDREAQRSFRKRTKMQIERLEHQISELGGEQLATQLDAVTKERDTLAVANQRLRHRIDSIESTLRGILSHPQKFESQGEAEVEQCQNVQRQSINNSSSISSCSILDSNASPAELIQRISGTVPDARRLHPIEPHALSLPNRPFSLASTEVLNMELEILGNTSANNADHATLGSHVDELYPSIDSWISTMNVFESGFSEHSIPWVCPPISLHQALPINSSPTCRVDVIWSEFIASRSPFKRTDDQRRGGGEQSETTGYPSLSHLLNPSTVASHPVGQLLTSILDMYCRPSAIPEQVAVLFKMYRLLRWQMAPTAENYDSLPDWLKPTTSQILTPYPSWIDQVVWPKARNFLIKEQESYSFQDFSDTFSSALRINWRYNHADVLLVQQAGTCSERDPVVLNPIFEQHILDLKNWTVTSKVSAIYPELAACCQI